MKKREIISVLELPLPVEVVFDFFSKAENLERITPPELHFEIESDKSVPVYAGATIQYRLQLYGICFGWRTAIREWFPVRRFVDEQIRGPYRLWRHVHEFEPTPANGTRIHDRVVYALPVYPVGEAAAPIVRWQLKRIFRYRQRQVIENLNQDPALCSWYVNG